MINIGVKCPICSSASIKIYINFPGYQKPYQYDIYECLKCDLSFVENRDNSSSDLYNHIYSKYKEIPGYSRYWHYYERIRTIKNPIKYLAKQEETYWGIQRALKSLIKQEDSHILEIGSGLGYLTFALNKSGYKVTGLDISQKAVSKAKEIFGDLYLCENVINHSKKFEGNYSIIILTEVIEHVADPVSFLSSLKRLLNDEGIIIMTTPNKSIFPKESIWNTDQPPVHFYWFSEKSIIELGKRLKLDTQFVNFKKYYRRNPKYFHVSSDISPSILNSDGSINKHYAIKSKNNSIKKTILKRLPLLHYLFARLKYKKDIVFCGSQGTTICTIFKKNIMGYES